MTVTETNIVIVIIVAMTTHLKTDLFFNSDFVRILALTNDVVVLKGAPGQKTLLCVVTNDVSCL